QDYKNVAKKEFGGNTLSLVNRQIDEFYRLSNIEFKNKKYKICDYVTLTPNTYLHGFGDDIKILDLFAEHGLINKDYEFGKSKHFTHHTVSLWHIRKKIKLSDYIVKYSGMSVRYEGKYEMVPYGKLDAFVEKMRNVPHWLWEAESTMEVRFMPSLARDKNQLAFIINGRDVELKAYFENDLINTDFTFDMAQDFINFKNEDSKNAFKNDRMSGDKGRCAYVVFGIPRNLFEGVLVGRKFEKNKKILKHIKDKLPNCYICNLDGKVIVE
ncbi:MAG: hypothetical protein IJW28_05490, partial [Clostridia bacterium]|nr:hypothetical protein [Clostridia bacterium]